MVAVISTVVFLTGGYTSVNMATALSAATWLLLPVLYTGLGALIATRQPGNRIASILFIVGLGLLLDGAVQPLVQTEPLSPGAVDYLALYVASSAWLVAFLPLFLLLYIFPTGRLLTRRWIWSVWLVVSIAIVDLGLGAVLETWTAPNEKWSIENPIGFVSDPVYAGPLSGIVLLLLVLLPLGGFAAMAVRYRRSGMVERTQIKWVLYAALVFALVYFGVALAVQLGGNFGDIVIGNVFAFSLALLPLSITAAITRYRLFEIDRIISRTLAYTLIVTLLGGVYFGLVTGISSLIPTQGSLAVAASTLVVAALFNPSRRRIQRAVDRRFNRSTTRAETITEQFAVKLGESTTVGEIVEAWNQTIVEALHPERIGIWLNPANNGEGRVAAPSLRA